MSFVFDRCAWLSLVVSLVPALAAQELQFFHAIRNYPLPELPVTSQAAGDLNGDGNLDFIFGSAREVGVLFGTGTKRVVPGPRSPSVDVAHHMVAADFTGDGKVDIVVSDQYNSKVVVLQPGRGDGRFGEPILIDARAANAIGAGDFNEDLLPDLVIVDVNSTFILLNRGGGKFETRAELRAGNPAGIAIADVNRDAHQDIVLGGQGASVTILLGDGAGAFRIAGAFQAGNVDLVAVADFNRDGAPDIATVNRDLSDWVRAATLTLFRGVGDGTFRLERTRSLPFSPNAISAADFNRDGAPELFLTGEERTAVLARNNNGTFRDIPGPTVPVYSLVTGLTVADLDRDGNLDAVTGNGTAATVLMGNGDGTMMTPPSFALQPGTTGAAAGDFDGDGLGDFAVANSRTGTILVLRSQPGGGLVKTQLSPAPGIGAIHACDVNKDGKLDLIGFRSAPAALVVLLGNGDGTFAERAAIPLIGQAVFPPAVGDFNRDGKLDIVEGLADSTAGTANDLQFIAGNGDGTFQSPLVFNAPGTRILSHTPGDFNEDGKLDLAYVSNQQLRILPGNGNGTFGAATVVGYYGASELLASDLNADGHTDLITTGIVILFGNGDGAFREPVRYVGGIGRERGLAVADLNGDGLQDLLFVAALQGNHMGVLLGTGSGAFASTRFYATGRSPLVAAPIQFNPYGRPDAAVVNQDSDSVTLLINVTGATPVE